MRYNAGVHRRVSRAARNPSEWNALLGITAWCLLPDSRGFPWILVTVGASRNHAIFQMLALKPLTLTEPNILGYITRDVVKSLRDGRG